MLKRRRSLLLTLTALTGLLLLFCRRGGSLTEPLVGAGDTEHLEWIPFLFGKMLTFAPWPQLTLFHNWVLYPTGGTTTYLPFSWESNYLVHAMNSIAGSGPWSLFYFGATSVFLFLATTWLLSTLYSQRLSVGVAFIIAFGNAYAQAKFPRHANMAYCHWTVLNLVYWFTLLSTIDRRELAHVRRLAMAAPLILCGALGQDPGYLIPWCLTLGFLSLLLIVVQRKSRDVLLDAISKSTVFQKRLLVSLGFASLFLFLYLPLNLQVAFDSWLNPPIEQGAKWANPLRWILPAFPYLYDGAWHAYKNVLTASGDGEMSGVPGWHLVVSALLGIST